MVSYIKMIKINERNLLHYLESELTLAKCPQKLKHVLLLSDALTHIRHTSILHPFVSHKLIDLLSI